VAGTLGKYTELQLLKQATPASKPNKWDDFTLFIKLIIPASPQIIMPKIQNLKKLSCFRRNSNDHESFYSLLRKDYYINFI